MKEFLRPNKKKSFLTIGLFMGLFSTTLLRKIPAQFDILDLHEIPGLLGIPFGRWPIQLFDKITASKFAAKGEGYIIFPSLEEFLFMLVFDILILYLLACLIVKMKKRKEENHAAQ